MNLCIMSIFRIICSVPMCFKLNDPMLWLSCLKAFDQILLNPVPVMMDGWICCWIFSNIWLIYEVEERIWDRVLLTILWEEVWIWCLIMLDILIRRANSIACSTCLVNWGFWFPSGWDVYSKYTMCSSVLSFLIYVWSSVLLEVVENV